MNNVYKHALQEHMKLFERLSSHEFLIEKVVKICVEAITRNNKIMFCGNGGSAADAQHLAAELVGRFLLNRRALPGLALTTDTSLLTSVSNDFSFDDVYARQVQSLGIEGDVLFVISTSGNSKNILEAASIARSKNIKVICLSGMTGGMLEKLADFSFLVPSSTTARIQEAHIFLGHIICQRIEAEMQKMDNE